MKDFPRNNMITMNDWLRFHPYDRPSEVDYYYQKLCNRLLKENRNDPLVDDMNGLEYKELTCMLVCLFEDVVSEINIWRSFTGEHKRLYGKFLPFYDTTDDYYDDEINLQDIMFLIWHFFSTVEVDILISPYYPVFNAFALKTLALFEAEYETAPANVLFKEKLKIPEEKEFFDTRNVMDFLAFQSYLNYHYTHRTLNEHFEQLEEEEHDAEYIHLLRYDTMVGVVINDACPLLALRVNEQLANIIGTEHPKYDLIRNISKRYAVTCNFKSINGKYWELEHLATGQHLNLASDTISEDTLKNQQFNPGDNLYLHFVKWGDEWALMGTMIAFPAKDDFDGEESEKHIFDPLEPKLEALKQQEACFKELTGGFNIAYFANTDEYDAFLNRFRVHVFEKSNPGKVVPDDMQAAKTDFGDQKVENFVIFFNPESGLEMMHSLSRVIKDARNPTYNPDEAADIQSLIIQESVSPQFVKFLVDNEMIAFDPNKEMDDATIKDNLDFLLRYYKVDTYYQEPAII